MTDISSWSTLTFVNPRIANYQLICNLILYKSVVLPNGEFANSVWCPFKQGDITEIDKKIQKVGN